MNEVRPAAGGVAAQASPWVQRLARFGYLAKGIVYMLVGALAVQAAFGSGQAAGSGGALRSLVDEPFGKVALVVIGVGLLSYALWRAYQAVLDPEDDGALHRVYSAGVALLHAGIGVGALRLAVSGTGGSNDGDTRRWTATALEQPLGRWLVGAVALGFIGWGIAQLVRAWKAKLDDQLELGRLDRGTRTWVRRVSRLGIAARGVVFGLIGFYLGRAALQFDPGEARDTGGALRSLEQQPMGPWLLAVVAAGLFAYGIYELLRARYRVIHTGDSGSGSGIRVERVQAR